MLGSLCLSCLCLSLCLLSCELLFQQLVLVMLLLRPGNDITSIPAILARKVKHNLRDDCTSEATNAVNDPREVRVVED